MLKCFIISLKELLKSYKFLEQLTYFYSDERGHFQNIIDKVNEVTNVAKYRRLKNNKRNRQRIAYYANQLLEKGKQKDSLGEKKMSLNILPVVDDADTREALETSVDSLKECSPMEGIALERQSEIHPGDEMCREKIVSPNVLLMAESTAIEKCLSSDGTDTREVLETSVDSVEEWPLMEDNVLELKSDVHPGNKMCHIMEEHNYFSKMEKKGIYTFLKITLSVTTKTYLKIPLNRLKSLRCRKFH